MKWSQRTFSHVFLNLFRIVSVNWNMYSSFQCCLYGSSTRWGRYISKTLLARTCVRASFVLSPHTGCNTFTTRTLCTELLPLLLLLLLLLSWLIGRGWRLRVWSAAAPSVKGCGQNVVMSDEANHTNLFSVAPLMLSSLVICAESVVIQSITIESKESMIRSAWRYLAESLNILRVLCCNVHGGCCAAEAALGKKIGTRSRWQFACYFQFQVWGNLHIQSENFSDF